MFLRLKGLAYPGRSVGLGRRGSRGRSGLVGTGLRDKLTRRYGAIMGILVRTGRTGCTLLPLVTYAGIRISGIMRLTRGKLLALLLVTLPAVGITPGVLPPWPLTVLAVDIPLLVLPLIPAVLPLWPVALPSTGISLLMLPLLVPPLLVLPLSRLTSPAVGIASGWLPPSPLTLPTEGMPLWLLPLPRLTLPAVGIATRRLKLSLLPLEYIGA